MGHIEWAMWANEQALASAAVTFLGGVVSIVAVYNNWEIGVFGMVASVIVFVIEYPRSKRKSGKSVERRFQKLFTIIVKQGGLVTRNYYIRFAFYLIITIPCCFILPTLIGAICFLITGIIYLVAAIKNEEWIPAGLDPPAPPRPAVIEQPQHPPPRRVVHDDSRESRI